MRQPDPPSPIVAAPPDEPIGLIQGQAPGSKNEWFVSQALDKLGYYYFYQFAIQGGRGARGGQVIDFLVKTASWTPVFVNGAYWHSIRMDPELPIKIAEARHQFGTEPVILEEEETSTREKALGTVRRKIR